MSERKEKESKKLPRDKTSVKGKLRDKYFLIVIAVQIVIIAALGVMTYSAAKHPKTISAPLITWDSKYANYIDDYWYIDHNAISKDNTVDMIYGPYVKLKKGAYLVTIDYECTSEQSAYVTSDDGLSTFLVGGKTRLYKALNSVSVRVLAKESVERFEVRVRFDSNGSLKINNIRIQSDYFGMARKLLFFLVLFAALDLIYLYYEKLAKNKETVFAVLAITLLVSLPLFTEGVNDGHDIDVHFMRIEAIANELRRGIFPVRQSNVWIEGYGYAASIYYGDFLLYIPAILRVLGIGVVTAYKTYVFLINFGTAVIGYCSFRRIFGSRNYGILASLAYCSATYRLTDIYVRAAVGEFSAIMFIPLVALGVYRLYTEDISDKRNYYKNSLIIAAGMSGIVCSHILSTEMVVLVLAILCLVLAVYTFRPRTLKAYALAVGETGLISAAFLVPFLDYYTSVSVRINDTVTDMETTLIQSVGVNIAEYFAFFRDPFSGYLSHHRNHKMILTPGCVLILILVLAFWFIVKKRVGSRSGRFYIYVGFSLLTLYMASNLFPWDVISLQPGFGNMMAQIQFPWRYVGISIIFLTLLLGSILQIIDEQKRDSKNLFKKAVILLCIIATVSFNSNYLDDSDFVNYFDTTDLYSRAVSAGEYILSDASQKPKYIDGKIKTENVTSAEITDRDSCHMEVSCEGSDKDGSITLPMFNYKYFYAVDDKGTDFDIDFGVNKQIKLAIPKNYSGTITVDFKPPIVWHISEAVTLLTILFFCFEGKIFKAVGSKKPKKEDKEKAAEAKEETQTAEE